MKTIEIWFAIDERTSVCGFVSAATALLFSSDCRLRIMAGYEKGKPSPVEWWEKKLERLGKDFEFYPIAVDLSRYNHCKGVFDSRVAFLRLEIPSLSNERLVVYSDADVIFQESIQNLVDEVRDFEKPVFLVQSTLCASQPLREKDLLAGHGKKMENPYFFSGLAVLRPELYNTENLNVRVAEIVKNNAAILDFHDQTIWNCALSPRHVGILDRRWCHAAFPGHPKSGPFESNGILHFVGSPKPWDLFAEFFHPFAQEWSVAAKRTGAGFYKYTKYLDGNAWRRALRIRKQYPFPLIA